MNKILMNVLTIISSLFVSFSCWEIFVFSVVRQRYQYADRISTAIDDYTHRSKSLSVEGWGCPRVNISMADLRAEGNGVLSQRLRRDPLPHLRALEAACHEIAVDARPGYDKNGTVNYKSLILKPPLRSL